MEKSVPSAKAGLMNLDCVLATLLVEIRYHDLKNVKNVIDKF